MNDEEIDTLGRDVITHGDEKIDAFRKGFKAGLLRAAQLIGEIEADEQDLPQPEPLRDADGSLHQSMLKVAGKRFRCSCGCNVFHQPDRTRLAKYRCNACDADYTSE